VLALSDEAVDTVSTFLDEWTDPFPERVASDALRTSYVSFGVSGTPTFVLVDEDGRIEWRQTGYSQDKGLGVEGWTWAP